MALDSPAKRFGRGEPSRWQILAGGTFALWTYSLLYLGMAVVAPAIRTTFHVGLAAAGVALGAISAGAALSLFLWGALADRIGDRVVMASGLILASAALAAASLTSRFAAFAVLLFAAGSFGASVNAPSARSVVAWFGRDRRGVALGIRQTAVPLGGLAAAAFLPFLSLDEALLGIALALLLGAVAAALTVRDRLHGQHEAAERLWRDRRVLLMSSASILLSTPQICLVGFSVLFLHDARGLSVAQAAAVFAAVQALGAGARIALGWWSDRLGLRVAPIRWVTVALASAVALTGLAVTAPLALLVPVIVAAGGLALAWNALVVTATAELAGVRRSGSALGLQQTGLAVWATVAPPAFAALVVTTSWRLSFVVVALTVASAYPVLLSVRLDPEVG